MIKLQNFLEKFNKVDISQDQDLYWQYYEHKDLFSWWNSPCGIEYNGKFKFHRTHDEIKEIAKKLTPYVITGEIPGFKYKSDKTPSLPEYADKLPPVFVYCKDKKKEDVVLILRNEGINDFVWIEDNRSALELQASQHFGK